MKRYPRMHVSLFVSDIKNSRRFYSNFFDVEPVKVKEDYMKYELENPGLTISFIENSVKAKNQYGHYGFQVSSVKEVEKNLLEMKAKGLEVKEEKDVKCCYAHQQKFWVKDPDGYQWEIYYLVDDVEENDPKYTGKSGAKDCC